MVTRDEVKHWYFNPIGFGINHRVGLKEGNILSWRNLIMKKKTIKKNQIRKDCWDLDYAFIKWLNERLKVYLRNAGKFIDLTYYKFTYKEKEYTQEELVKYLIRVTEDLIPMDTWDKEYDDLCNEMLDIWKLIFPTMWW